VGLSPVRQYHLIPAAISVCANTEMASLTHYSTVSMVLESSNNLWNVAKALFQLNYFRLWRRLICSQVS
jgi:hypothetical protein